MEQDDDHKFPVRMCVAERPIPGAKFDYGVSEEYRGSKRDQEEMKILGKDQVLRVRCS